MYQIERRHIDRFKVPGAKALYYTSCKLTNIVPLIDISISATRFELPDDFNESDIIDIELIIPSKKKILLKGKAIRISKNGPENPDYAAVQFLPFGSDKLYNSTDSYKQLKELIAECEERLEDYRRSAIVE